MKTLRLPVIITQDEDGYYIAEVPVLQSCYTQGKTKEEALFNLKEVVQLCLEHMTKEGNPIPEQYSLDQIEVAV
jgi:predicted RNase H-like HicB family nuclease